VPPVPQASEDWRGYRAGYQGHRQGPLRRADRRVEVLSDRDEQGSTERADDAHDCGGQDQYRAEQRLPASCRGPHCVVTLAPRRWIKLSNTSSAANSVAMAPAGNSLRVSRIRLRTCSTSCSRAADPAAVIETSTPRASRSARRRATSSRRSRRSTSLLTAGCVSASVSASSLIVRWPPLRVSSRPDSVRLRLRGPARFIRRASRDVRTSSVIPTSSRSLGRVGVEADGEGMTSLYSNDIYLCHVNLLLDGLWPDR